MSEQHKHQLYEQFKANLAWQNLTATEYERAIRDYCKRNRI